MSSWTASWAIGPRASLDAWPRSRPRGPAARQRPPASARIRRVTSAPSARPRVSRITAPISAPIAFSLPSRTFCAASASAAITRSTISASSPPSLDRAKARAPRRSLAGSPPVGEQRVQHLARRRLRQRARRHHLDERGRAPPAQSRAAGSSSPIRATSSPATQLARRRRLRRRRPARARRSRPARRGRPAAGRDPRSAPARARSARRARPAARRCRARRLDHRRVVATAARSGSGK